MFTFDQIPDRIDTRLLAPAPARGGFFKSLFRSYTPMSTETTIRNQHITGKTTRDTKDALERLAHETDRSVAEIVHEAVAAYIRSSLSKNRAA